MRNIEPFLQFGRVGPGLWGDLVRSPGASLLSRALLVAENSFLRRQLALYRERHVKPRRAADPERLTLGLLARSFPWRETFMIVRPAPILRWDREAFRPLWRWRPPDERRMRRTAGMSGNRFKA